MKMYMIEREVPRIGSRQGEQLRQAAARSNRVWGRLGRDVQWYESILTADKMFCVYLAEDEAIVRKHADESGFPTGVITEISRTIDPTAGM